MKKLLCCWLLLLVVPSVQAVLVEGLYSARAEVPDMSVKAREQAAQAALAAVFVKVSGSEAVLRNDIVRGALKEAGQRLLQYSYHSRQDQQREMEAAFDDIWVNSVIAQARAPLWTANRPAVLTWLVLERDGAREFVSNAANAAQLADLKAAFTQRGLPLQLPLMDLQDAAALKPEQLWRLDDSALRGASKRYNVEDVLVGRFVQSPEGRWAGDWVYLSQDGRKERRAQGEQFADVAKTGVAEVASAMSQRFAVAADVDQAGVVTLHVAGIYRYADYASVVQLLERIELIERIDVVRVANDVVTLALDARTTADQLAGLIEMNRQLAPMTMGQVAGELSYQWIN